MTCLNNSQNSMNLASVFGITGLSARFSCRVCQLLSVGQIRTGADYDISELIDCFSDIKHCLCLCGSVLFC